MKGPEIKWELGVGLKSRYMLHITCMISTSKPRTCDKGIVIVGG